MPSDLLGFPNPASLSVRTDARGLLGIINNNGSDMPGFDTGSGGLLDSYRVGMWAACGLRRLVAGNGPCLRIRRADTLAESDIAFLPGSGAAINATQLNAFISGTTGQVVTIYDQTGNGNHAVISTPSRLIWDGSVWLVANTGVNASMTFTNSVPSVPRLTVLARGTLAATNGGGSLYAFLYSSWNDATSGAIYCGSSANLHRSDIGGSGAANRVGMYHPSADVSASMRTRMGVFDCGLIGNAANTYYSNGANYGLSQNYSPTGPPAALLNNGLTFQCGGVSAYTFNNVVVWTNSQSTNAAAIHALLL